MPTGIKTLSNSCTHIDNLKTALWEGRLRPDPKQTIDPSTHGHKGALLHPACHHHLAP
ncbi:hypothetical protein GP5015_2103 [gamma proteobacterium HTCC5015]|nr:hypothetical protein GP5015_2103 [gamma proteobacterium HTCC5015]